MSFNHLLESPPTSCEIGGVTYTLNTAYTAALWTWKVFGAFEIGEIDKGAYATALVENMFLEPKPTIFDDYALCFAADYLNAFSDKDGERKTKMPPIDIEQDSAMIYSAFLSMGIHLKRDNVTYEDFMSYLREIPKDSEYCHIMRLRVDWYDRRGKMKPEELKRLKGDCRRVGWDKILIRDKKAEKEQEDNKNFFKELQNKKRLERGLPPL